VGEEGRDLTTPERDTGRHADGPAFYATAAGGWRQWWTVLHPPYTAWHLSYVVIGACLAPSPRVSVLVATLLAFFLAVGVAAHALDELNGRPLATSIPAPALVGAGVIGLGGALAVGAVGVTRVGYGLIPFIVVGAAFVLGYDLELAGGRLHTDAGFALSWGAFPVLTAYFAQAERLDLVAVAAAVGAFALSWAQRVLSTPARTLRRRALDASGRVVLASGEAVDLDRARLLAPLEAALKALSVACVALAVALAVARLG
jgi:hypothetical protein